MAATLVETFAGHMSGSIDCLASELLRACRAVEEHPEWKRLVVQRRLHAKVLDVLDPSRVDVNDAARVELTIDKKTEEAGWIFIGTASGDSSDSPAIFAVLDTGKILGAKLVHRRLSSKLFKVRPCFLKPPAIPEGGELGAVLNVVSKGFAERRSQLRDRVRALNDLDEFILQALEMEARLIRFPKEAEEIEKRAMLRKHIEQISEVFGIVRGYLAAWNHSQPTNVVEFHTIRTVRWYSSNEHKETMDKLAIRLFPTAGTEE